MSRRQQYDIDAEILQRAKNGARKTELVYGCNLNFKLLARYLKRLIEKGLLKHVARRFETTERGRMYLSRYKGMKAVVLNGALS